MPTSGGTKWSNLAGDPNLWVSGRGPPRLIDARGVSARFRIVSRFPATVAEPGRPYLLRTSSRAFGRDNWQCQDLALGDAEARSTVASSADCPQEEHRRQDHLDAGYPLPAQAGQSRFDPRYLR